MNEESIRLLLRAKGLCGWIDGPPSSRTACVLDPGHDTGLHDVRWCVSKRVDCDPYAGDSRESITTWLITDGRRRFVSSDQSDAIWLSSKLTRLGL